MKQYALLLALSLSVSSALVHCSSASSPTSSVTSSAGSDGTGSSSSSSPTIVVPPAIAKVTCTSNPDAAGTADECSCQGSSTIFAGATALADYSGTDCGGIGPALDVAPLCCADPDYPGSGSCDCVDGIPTGKGMTWNCFDAGPYCSCSFGMTALDSSFSPVASCSITAGVTETPDGSVCCSNGLDYCTCQLYDSCAAGEMEVSDCSTPSSTGLPPFRTACAVGRVEVLACTSPSPVTRGTGSGTGVATSTMGTTGGSCTGAAEACEGRSSCAAGTGCSSSQKCSGDAHSCEDLGEGSCEGQEGCDWDEEEFSCSGEATSCDEIDECFEQEGCTEMTVCSGAATPCTSLTSETDCEEQTGCSWSG